MSAWIQSGIGLLVALLSFVWMRATEKKEAKPKETHISWMPVALFVVSMLYCVGFSLYLGVQFAWIFMAVIIVLAVLFRIVWVPRMHEMPKGLQGMVEAGVEKTVPVKIEVPKKAKTKKRLQKFLFLTALWFTFGRILMAVYGSYSGKLEVSLFPDTVSILGFSVSHSILITWAIIAVIAVFALLFRVFVVPRFKEHPGMLQNLFEESIEAISSYTHGQMHSASESLTCYMFTLAVLMVGCAFVELLGIRPPTADLKLTMSMAIVTFVMINYYGFRRKGFFGRLKSLAQPSVFIMPIKLLTDLAIPISLSCRLFGNMLGGMIVMDLLRISLGTNAIGIPPVAGLYFNVFHPLIQAYIFITLSLTFINEAVE